jgi:hypothetical protein
VRGDGVETQQSGEGDLVVARHDVPGDPPRGEVVERRVGAGVQVRLLRRRRRGHHEPQPIHGRREAADERHRIVGGDLHRFAHDRIGDVVAAHRIAECLSEEQEVEPARLELARHLLPVAEGREVAGLRPRVVPGVADEVRRELLEGAQDDLLGHGVPLPAWRDNFW